MNNIRIVHNLEQAKAALAEAGDAEIVVQSAPGALGYQGSMYILNMFRKAQVAYPQARATCILDAGDACGEVIVAIQDGHKNIKSSAKPQIRAKLVAISRENGVNLIETG